MQILHEWRSEIIPVLAQHASKEAVERSLEAMMCAALLHDVMEDCGVTEEVLRECSVDEQVIWLVSLLTKANPHGPLTVEDMERVAQSFMALIIKCADRMSNLESATVSVRAGHNQGRWAKYVRKTRNIVLPFYGRLPQWQAALEYRLGELEDALARQKVPL